MNLSMEASALFLNEGLSVTPQRTNVNVSGEHQGTLQAKGLQQVRGILPDVHVTGLGGDLKKSDSCIRVTGTAVGRNHMTFCLFLLIKHSLLRHCGFYCPAGTKKEYPVFMQLSSGPFCVPLCHLQTCLFINICSCGLYESIFI